MIAWSRKRHAICAIATSSRWRKRIGDFGGKGLTLDEYACYFLAKASGRPVLTTPDSAVLKLKQLLAVAG